MNGRVKNQFILIPIYVYTETCLNYSESGNAPPFAPNTTWTLDEIHMTQKKPTYEILEKRVYELEQAASDHKATEKQLRKSEEKYRTLIENVQDLFYRTDLDGRIIFISPSVYRLSGYTMEEAMGMKIAQEIYLRPQERKLFLQGIQDNGYINNFESWLKHKDGTIWRASTNAHFYKDKDGRILGVEGITRDVTDLNRAEEINNVLFAISNAVNTTRNLKDLYPIIHQSLSRIIDVTNFFIAIVDTIEQTLFFPYHVDTTDDDFFPITDFNPHHSLTGLVVSQRSPLLLEKKALENRASQNGVWGPIPVIWMGVPLIIKDQVIGVIAVQSYINPLLYTKHDLQILSAVSDQVAIAIDRKRGEEQTQASEKRFREIIEEVSAISIQGYDEKRRVIFWNQASEKLYGYPKSEAMGKTLEKLIIPSNMREHIKNLHQRWVEFGEKIPPAELTLMGKNGNKVPVFSSHVMLETHQGKEMFCIDIDLRPLRQAQKEKLEAQKTASEQKKLALIGQIAGKMAHDFNNILGIIMGNAELSLINCGEDETRKTFELIFNQTLRGKNLTKNLMAFAKTQEPKAVFFQLNKMVDQVISLLKNDLMGIQLVRGDQGNLPDLLADPGMIEYTLVNILQNSIHAVSMKKNPKIFIKTCHPDNTICFEIEDNGCGMAPENIEKIYDPSFTLKGSRDLTHSYGSDIKGSGYGLANVKKYIDQHRGHISISSKIDSGTKVCIQFPVMEQSSSPTNKTDPQKARCHSGKYILLVEDEPAISEVQQEILSQEPFNHRVDTAADGETAMDLFKKNNYDMVSLDYLLSGVLTGIDVYHFIRGINKTIPLVFISGNLEFLESIDELKRQDPHIDHLPKPCQNKDYMDTINKLFQRQYLEPPGKYRKTLPG